MSREYVRGKCLSYYAIGCMLVACAYITYSSYNYPKDNEGQGNQRTPIEEVFKSDQDRKAANVSHHEETTTRPSAVMQMTPSHKGINLEQYYEALEKYSSKDKWILLAMADEGCVDMTINFYLTSLAKFKITNYLIIGISQHTCDKLKPFEINCYLLINDADAAHASVYHAKDFLRKMNIRTYMILDGLRLGFNILHSDVDVYFMKDPFEGFDFKNSYYDVAPLMDNNVYNAGFLFIRNTTGSIATYNASRKIADTEPKTDDQRALNRAISSVSKQRNLMVKKLPMDKYQCGKIYWEDKGRNFAGQQHCGSCVVVHNNWIVSMEAKRYRFRELHLWEYDGNGYYSNTKAKYLTFDNEVTLRDAAKEDILALKNAVAIGEILNRTVILPKFHCSQKRCTVLNHLKLRNFEAKFDYREHSFLDNPLVPNQVKNSRSDILIICSEKYLEISKKDQRTEKVHSEIYQPNNTLKGATSDEIIKWFGSMNQSVLQFDNLLGAFWCFSDSVKQNKYEQKLKDAFVPGKYRQV